MNNKISLDDNLSSILIKDLTQDANYDTTIIATSGAGKSFYVGEPIKPCQEKVQNNQTIKGKTK